MAKKRRLRAKTKRAVNYSKQMQATPRHYHGGRQRFDPKRGQGSRGTYHSGLVGAPKSKSISDL